MLKYEVMKMQEKPKKKFDMPTAANTDGEISIRNGLRSNQPLEKDERFQGDSVDEHNKLESANEIIAEKEISQTYNNS